MTWSLQLVGGDLAKGKGNSLAQARGPNKVQQDLFNWIMTEIGSDPFFPSYGSIIRFEPGERVVIGGEDILTAHDDRLDLMMSEINRIIEEYQKRQLSRIKQEVITYEGRHTFDAGEIIETFNVEYETLFDTLYIDIYLTMLSGHQQSIEIEL